MVTLITGDRCRMDDRSREIGPARDVLIMAHILDQQSAYRFFLRVSKNKNGNIYSLRRKLFMTQYIISYCDTLYILTLSLGKVRRLAQMLGEKMLAFSYRDDKERATSMKGERYERRETEL